MKYLNRITLGLILCAGLLSSCKDDDEPGIPGGITIDKEEITVGPEGGIEKLAVLSDIEWVANASRPWVTVSPANGSGSAECSLAIDTTLENTSRTAQVRFSLDGHEPKMITITQFGFGKQIVLKEAAVEIENSAAYDKRYFEATISTNVNFKIDKAVEYFFAEAGSMTEEEKIEMESEKADWLTLPQDKDLEVNLDRKARPRTIKVRFRWEMNTAPFTRVAKIRLLPQKPEEDQLVDNDGNPVEAIILTVTQKPALKIEDNRAGDSLAVITINQKIQGMMVFDTSENMQNWENVTLWEATDKLPAPEAVGRIRSVNFMIFNLKEGETLPKEVRYLKYLESFFIQSNENRQTRNVSLCNEICELKYLKKLGIYSYGLTELPEDFIKLGGEVDRSYEGLEELNLGSNNFANLSQITEVVNEKNFPKLYSLNVGGCRRVDIISDLTKLSGGKYNGREIGLYVNLDADAEEKEAFIKLLTWDNLRNLSLSYNFIEGKLPTDAEIEAALVAAKKPVHYQADDFYTKADLTAKPLIYLDKLSADTCQWLLTDDNPVVFMEKEGKTANPVTKTGQEILRVLPKIRSLSFNLNYFTGPLPNWILFHPYFVEWNPATFIFSLEGKSKDSAGNTVGFSNIDAVKFDYDYYYGVSDPGTETVIPGVAYPLYYRRYVAN